MDMGLVGSSGTKSISGVNQRIYHCWLMEVYTAKTGRTGKNSASSIPSINET
ncbi:Uncharacterised protein [Salmonella enterica subsp. enterica serovar Bovismorbificans]|uniref:Uncharacterized protein n=1 Tax=Salmonella enterica subsp. enterica serovar Bovismorbificans TaxID=58097 RepID=A0A655C7S1_SALET|nr:Uncharacterised protein [Salmonella enterica subsp. enterica serovar Bovismorbificans]CNU23180.1 Uncharacterised protein [Salmonella enterica subsp. enterica serovar Bovismorbificans]CPR75938.1 Uncharacterised protein [Salmonella enterica subsp. enterica serovar Bovismorbificans]